MLVNQSEPNQYESEDSTGLPNRHSTKRLRLEVRPSIQISIDIEPPSPGDRSPNRPTQLIIPQLIVEQASPIKERLPIMYPGSPPPQRQSVGETNFFAPQKQRRLVQFHVYISKVNSSKVKLLIVEFSAAKSFS